jgi:methylthioribose-1-phosphate isomerase
MVRPLRFEDGALLVLDQRRLPAEETWLRCERPGQVAEAIRTLAVRGAPAIGLAAAYGVALAGDDGADATPAELVDAIFTEAGVLELPDPDSIAAALGGR